MGCCGERDKGPPEKKQRWHYLDLNEFRCTSAWTYVAYGWLWFMAFVSISVYSVDTFTCINLLVFDHWSSQVKPFVPFKYSRWIFAICILASFALLIYEWFRALRVMRRDGVAASYMDRIAASVQCMKSQGWKRFLVFTELTKSKKGTDYVAFFVYFAFSGALRIILCEAPRQGVNAMTLYAVLTAKIIDQPNPNDGQSGISQFFSNIGALYDENYLQAMIYTSMLFTLTIWVFSALCLAAAGLLYIMFLWHYIPQRDGRLRIYCRRKIDRRLEKVVEKTTAASIEYVAKQQAKMERRAELKRQKTGELPPPPGPGKLARAPTLPDVKEDKKSTFDSASLKRQDTNASSSTLPLYSSRPPTSQGMQRQPTLPNITTDFPPQPSFPSRTATQASGLSKASFESDAPLLHNAGYAGGDDRIASPAPTHYSRKPSSSSLSSSIPARTNTQSTQASQRSFTPGMRIDTPASVGQRSYTPGAWTETPASAGPRSYTPMSATSARPPPGQRFPVRTNTGFSVDEPRSAVSDGYSPVDAFGRAPGPPMRQNTADGSAFRPPPQRKDSEVSYFSRPIAAPAPPMQRHMTHDSVNSSIRGAPPPMQRRGTQDSVNPPLRGPTPAHARAGSFSRPFTPAYMQTVREQPTPPAGSYEMTPQSAGAGLYMPFNPSQHQQHAGTPVYAGATRQVTNDYFGHAPQRSLTAPIAEGQGRALSSYGSILDDYGATSVEPEDAPRPGPGGPLGRSYTDGWGRY